MRGRLWPDRRPRPRTPPSALQDAPIPAEATRRSTLGGNARGKAEAEATLRRRPA
jgi:hypothetical protein